jgi:hypothetical protein
MWQKTCVGEGLCEGMVRCGRASIKQYIISSLNLGFNHLFEGAGLALAESVHINTTLTSLNLYRNCLGDSGRRALAESLRLNTTLTSLDLDGNGLERTQGGNWQRHCASVPS